MQKSFMRIPYTGPLPAPSIIPRNANTLPGAIAALSRFLTAPPLTNLTSENDTPCDLGSTVILSGAGISVASGLADYRGTNGTYRVNKTYRPIYYHEFFANHEARKRYWARSFLGWTNLHKARPNSAHYAIKALGDLGFVKSVITQNVDSFHLQAHPAIPTLELHGYLRSLVCISCRNELNRDVFQKELARLNPAWADFLQVVIASGARDTEDPNVRKERGVKTNPDGDVDLPGAPYSTFRYPACPHCLAEPTTNADGKRARVVVDDEGAWLDSSDVGILKPNVVMFGESIREAVKTNAERAIEGSGKLLVVGTSLATYSAWRLARKANVRGMPIAVLNLGGVRGEDAFFQKLPPAQTGEAGVRIEFGTDQVLPGLVEQLKRRSIQRHDADEDMPAFNRPLNSGVFNDMLS